MGNFKFGKFNTKDYDLVIQTEPIYTFPSKDVTVEHIPGRNGDLVIDNKCWQNVERVYSIASVFRPSTDFIINAERLIKSLTQEKGYQRLEDSYDPDVFRMAEYKNSGALQNLYGKATVLNVTFNCKPQRYLKKGENPIEFVGSVASLENPTGYPALPLIEINGITHVENQVLLVTVRNENKVVSTITLSDVPSGDVSIDSELQTVWSNQNGDINQCVNLNDKEFPSLGKDITEITVDKYTEDTTIIKKYETVMADSKASCLALYKPYDALVESKQKSIYIKSYNLLKQQFSEVYEAEAYANYCLKKAEEYTFISFNTILTERSQSYSFQTDYSSKPSWLDIAHVDPNDPTSDIIVRVGDLRSFDGFNTNKAYFITNSSSDKVIRKLSTGDTIGTFRVSATVTITVYPATNDNDAKLAIDYSDYNMPSWLDFNITYDNAGSPTKITFKSNASGYFYLPKSGYFGKAGWAMLNANTDLTSLSWDSSKKAFMPSGVISTSTTKSFQYYYLAEVPQYETTYRDVLDENGNVKKDANGNPIQEPEHEVHFEVVALDSTLTNIKYVATKTGYFRCNNADQGTGWRKVTERSDIPSSCGFENTIKSPNTVYFMEELPTYEKVEGFPDWLNPIPDLIGGDISNGNPAYVELKTKVANWFRCTYITNDEKELYNEWTYLATDTSIADIGNTHKADDSYSIYMIEGESEEFPIKTYSYTDAHDHTINDIGFFYIDDHGQQQEYEDNIPPSWLEAEVIPGVNEDGSDTTIKFKAASAGSYNWDASPIWVDKSVGGELVTSSNKDDTSIYYLASTPVYPIPYPLFDIVVNKNSANGNPESISFIVKEGKSGYFRAKTSSSWKYYEEGEEICNSKITESTTIYNLESAGSLEGLDIRVIPRWWSL